MVERDPTILMGTPLAHRCRSGDVATFNRLVTQDPQKLFDLNYKEEIGPRSCFRKFFTRCILKMFLIYVVANNLTPQFLEKDRNREKTLFDRAFQTNDPKKIAVVADFYKTQFPDQYQHFIFKMLENSFERPDLRFILLKLVNQQGADINYIDPDEGTILDVVYAKQMDHLAPLFQEFGAKTRA